MAAARFGSTLATTRWALVLALVAGVASAEVPARPYRLLPAVDVPVMVVSAGVWLVPEAIGLNAAVTPKCPCDAQQLNVIDRAVLGKSSREAAVVSDISLVAFLALPVLLDAIDVGTSGSSWGSYAEDLVVMAESVLLSGAINQVVKLVAQRPRPKLYGLEAGDSALTSHQNYLSFYSAHTSTTFAAGMAYASTFARRHPNSPLKWLNYAVAAVLGGVVGLLRIESGNHFPTDVVVGAAVGTALGLVVPWLHDAKRSVAVSVVPVPQGAMLSWSTTLP